MFQKLITVQLHLPLSLGFLCVFVVACLGVKAIITLQINKYVGVVVAEICSELRQTLINRLLEARRSRAHHLLRSSRSLRNTVLWSGASGRSGNASRNRAITVGL